MADLISRLAQELGIRPQQAESAVRLLDEGNTVPFIARYRKEATGSLDDGKLRALEERLAFHRAVEARREEVRRLIDEQGSLSASVAAALDAAGTVTEIDDVYRPFRPKRRTRASIAAEAGLTPLADLLWAQDAQTDPHAAALPVRGRRKGRARRRSRAQGRDGHPCRARVGRRRRPQMGARIHVQKRYARLPRQEKGRGLGLPRLLRLRRAAAPRAAAPHSRHRPRRAGGLPLRARRGQRGLYPHLSPKPDVQGREPLPRAYVADAAADAYDRLIAPSVQNELRGALTETAHAQAMRVFGENLKHLLLQPPVRGKVVMGFDPAYRTGCKIAVVDDIGAVVDTAVVYPTPPQNKTEQAKKTLGALIKKHKVDILSIGNGTASKESEIFAAELLREQDRPVAYVMTNESGASVYSASALAAKELPGLDVSLRSAVSIARRLQDPLAELVKIDPKAIGVGQYQHDMPPKQLDEALGGVVEDCVNRVGVDLNTASASLLGYVSGLSATVAKNIVAWREENGAFTSRAQLKKVPKLGPKAYEQCAGFLRIPHAKNVLDNTGVHPESYDAAKALLARFGYTLDDVAAGNLTGLPDKVRAARGGKGRGGMRRRRAHPARYRLRPHETGTRPCATSCPRPCCAPTSWTSRT